MSALLGVSQRLAEAVDGMSFSPPVTHWYNPLVYARAPHMRYLDRYGCARDETLLVGMNPGPWGMAQTGVPFGEVSFVRDWMGIEEPVGKPPREHEKRPILGFGCTRSEVSGARLWGWARDRFGTPDAFFARFFVHNYCPLSFMEASGRNFTPNKLPTTERAPLFAVCDQALCETVKVLRPRFLLGIGAFAGQRIRAACPGYAGVTGNIPHPSPASPAANRGWAAAAEDALRELGVEL